MRKGTTVEAVERMNVDIEALKSVRDQLQDEIQAMHRAKAILANERNMIDKDIREGKLRKEVEIRRANEVNDLTLLKREQKVYNMEKNLEVIQRQLGDREATVSDREKRVFNLEQKGEQLKQESLQVRQLKAQAQQEFQQASLERETVASKIAIAREVQEDAASKLRLAQEYRDSVVNLDARLQSKEQELALRERTLSNAEEIFSRKLVVPQATATEVKADEIPIQAVSQAPTLSPPKKRGRPRKTEVADGHA